MRQGNSRLRAGKRKKRYRSLSGFYIDDPRRESSAERDIGLWWREGADGPLHRAAWVKETGELYLVRLGPPEQGGGEVELLATVADRARLDDALRGWRERCGERRSLAWLRARASRLDGGAQPRGERPRLPLANAGADAGTMLSAMSSLTSELARQSSRRTRTSAPAASRRRLPRVAPSSSSV
jgi:hypothetical protein